MRFFLVLTFFISMWVNLEWNSSTGWFLINFLYSIGYQKKVMSMNDISTKIRPSFRGVHFSFLSIFKPNINTLNYTLKCSQAHIHT